MLAALVLALLTTVPPPGPYAAWGGPRFDLDCKVTRDATGLRAVGSPLRISVDLGANTWRVGPAGAPATIRDVRDTLIIFDDDGARRIRRFMAIDRDDLRLKSYIDGYGTGYEADCALAPFTAP